MENLYFYSIIIGGFLMLGQFLLSLIGMHDEIDLQDFNEIPDSDIDGGVDADHGAGRWFVGILSFRAIVTALTVFGLVGMGATKQFPNAPMNAFIIAILAGVGVLYLTGWIIHAMHQMKSDGSVNIEEVIGEQGTVYLTIPGSHSGKGKVSVVAQNRTMEYLAMTPDDEIKTGSPVLITGTISPDVLEVKAAVEQTTIQN